MNLRQQLAACQQDWTQWPPIAAPCLAQKAACLRPIDLTPVMPSMAQQLKLYKKFGHALATHDWHQIQAKDWRRVPWLLWYGKKLHHLIIQRGFLARFFQRIKGHPSGLKRLIYVYLLHFAHNKPHIDRVAQFIVQQLEQLPAYSALQHWQQAQQQYHLFESNQGVDALALRCLQQAAIPLLTQAGLSGKLLSGGYAQAVYQQALAYFMAADIDDKKQALPLLLAWSEHPQQLRYPHCKKNLIEALLQPWLQTDCPKEIRTRSLLFLLQHAQHPVINQHDWQTIKPPLFKLFKQWANGWVLDLFFDLVLQYQWVDDGEARQAFWQSCQQQQIIDDAWLILNPTMARFFENNEAHASLKHCYGVFDDPQLDMKQLALLLRIQNLIIVLWADGDSHLLWSLKNPYLPLFYKSHYTADAIQHPSEQLPIIEGWQQTLLTTLLQRTQIRLSVPR